MTDIEMLRFLFAAIVCAPMFLWAVCEWRHYARQSAAWHRGYIDGRMGRRWHDRRPAPDALWPSYQQGYRAGAATQAADLMQLAIADTVRRDVDA